MAFLLRGLMIAGAAAGEAAAGAGVSAATTEAAGTLVKNTAISYATSYVMEKVEEVGYAAETSILGKEQADELNQNIKDIPKISASILSGNDLVSQHTSSSSWQEKARQQRERVIRAQQKQIEQQNKPVDTCTCETNKPEINTPEQISTEIKPLEIKKPDSIPMKDTTAHIANLIIGNSKALADNNITDGIEHIAHNLDTVPIKTIDEVASSITVSPPEYSTMQKMSNYYADKSLSNSKEFKEIQEIYNGKGFEPRNVIMSEDYNNWIFDLYDETGKLIHLTQDKRSYTLPAVYGNFGGSFSPNNNLPVDIPDTVFLAHDADYSVSYFNWKSDMKLVSRLVARRNDWPIENVNQLNTIVIYFANIGASLAVMKGSIMGDPSTEVINDEVKDDIFPVIHPEMLDLPQPEYCIERYNFYNQIATELKTSHSTKGIFSGNNYVSNFGKINISLL